jgi:hypothetical protein
MLLGSGVYVHFPAKTAGYAQMEFVMFTAVDTIQLESRVWFSHFCVFLGRNASLGTIQEISVVFPTGNALARFAMLKHKTSAYLSFHAK